MEKKGHSVTLGLNERESRAFRDVRPRMNAARSLRELLRRMWAEGYVIQAHSIDHERDREHWDIVYAPWIWNNYKGPRKRDQLVGHITRTMEDGTWHFHFYSRQDSNHRILFKLRKGDRRYNRVVNAAIAVEWWQE